MQKLDLNGNAFNPDALEIIREAAAKKPEFLDSLSENDEEGEVDEDDQEFSEEDEAAAASVVTPDSSVDALTQALEKQQLTE